MKETETLTTDFLFNEMLPSFLNIDGELFHFNMFKGKNGPIIEYKTNEGKFFNSTRRSGTSLREASEKSIVWLKESGAVEHMPFGYKEKYEKIFNIKIEHSRGFKK